MRYQDLKIRDMFRMLAISAAFALTIVVFILFRAKLEPLIDSWGSYRTHGNLFVIILAVCGIMSAMCLFVFGQYLFTSPEQNAKTIQKANAKMPPTLLKTDNPQYSVPTWRYFVSRLMKP